MERLSNASLIGNYAVADTGSGGQTPQAGVSVATYDGKGSFSGVTLQDVPGRTFRERVFVRAPCTRSGGAAANRQTCVSELRIFSNREE
jgi:hypothetical protein